MPLNTKHTGNFSTLPFIIMKGGNILLLVVVLLFSVSQGFANEQDAQQVYTNGDNTIVYKATETGNVVITEGTITAIEGKTIRLLPGTHIKSSEQLTVNIASKACQEAVAYEVAQKREATMLAVSAKKREEIVPLTLEEIFPLMLACNTLPENSSTVTQQGIYLAAALTTTTVSFSAPVLTLHKKISDLNKYLPGLLACLLEFTPVTSWGNCAENIKVMRC